ncbi:MAG: 16S rRNA (guanine(527)-N(7))-methyltransferase RsmG [SAR324 cluster bacterium]|nr:16S rRNA (guanine(527)-N(7))-methyltransferase RsmG [SAR324 cluster bacterium]
MNNPSVKIRHILDANQIFIAETQWALLQQWVELLREHNQKINLISRNDADQIWEKHILPSLAILAVRKFPTHSEICDLGTGGGLPGIPLAIIRPDLQFTMIDSIEKKIHSVQSMISALPLPNANVVLGRAEELGKKHFHQHFSFITARAVSSLVNLEKWTRSLRKPNSVLHAYKGGDMEAEIQQACKISSIRHIEETSLQLKKDSQLLADQKKIVTLHFV